MGEAEEHELPASEEVGLGYAISVVIDQRKLGANCGFADGNRQRLADADRPDEISAPERQHSSGHEDP